MISVSIKENLNNRDQFLHCWKKKDRQHDAVTFQTNLKINHSFFLSVLELSGSTTFATFSINANIMRLSNVYTSVMPLSERLHLDFLVFFLILMHKVLILPHNRSESLKSRFRGLNRRMGTRGLYIFHSFKHTWRNGGRDVVTFPVLFVVSLSLKSSLWTQKGFKSVFVRFLKNAC